MIISIFLKFFKRMSNYIMNETYVFEIELTLIYIRKIHKCVRSKGICVDYENLIILK